MMDYEAILKLAESKESSDIFAIGVNDKYGISISDQQLKALTLVWALIEGKKVRKNSKVAVVGGGFSGVTAALAIAVKAGCCRV